MAAAAPPPSSLPGVLAELAGRLGDELRVPPRSVASFPRVDAAALPFLLALLGARGRVWFVADGVREAERVHDDLLALLPEAILLPELTIAAGSDGEIDPELAAEQLHAASRIRQAEQGLGIVLTRAAWDGGVLGGDAGEELTLRRGQAIGLDEVIARLAAAGFERLPQTAERGQFAVRGGVLDFFAPAQLQPVRLEWFGDEIESIRAFDVHSQASSEELAEVRCTLQAGVSGKREETATLVQPDDVVVALREGVITARRGQVPAAEAKAAARELSLLDLAPRADVWWRDDEVGREAGRQRALSQLQYWAREGVHFTIALSEHEEPARAELLQMIAPLPGPPQVVPGRIASAVLLRGLQRAVLPAALLLGHRQRAQVGTRPNWLARRGAAIRRESSESSQAFEAGDLVVHEEHGIARFRGLGPSPHEPEGPAMLELEFEGGARIYVPLEQSHLVGRYQGLGKQRPSLSRLGEARWASALRSAQTATKNYAATLLRLQAMRETGHGEAFPPDGEWQAAFEASFPYQETPDQLRSIADTKRDMESTRPMDRLICGDVGFGKTEVAIRAAFKAAAAGRQVALMAPTTVLAQQHFDNWKARFADYPIRVDSLTRFRSAAEQRAVIRDVARGAVDVLIGTHRVISDDVAFKDLGLLIVDEEQRFGVKHKERMKERYPLVDILTLSATPIPRTLYMALTGARDMSVLETPPPSRYPVETSVCAYDERLIREAITRELAREGQVFFLHNRIATIERTAARIAELCPGAKVEIGHGQMDEDQLDEVMHRFIAGQTDVLVSTTIIESGIDIPNANTIIIDRADRFGLADLYQLRGRVGRSTHRAYAYLLLPRELMGVGPARKRIEAIRQYTSLGAGFQIAMRDLEIRGAGNLLGLSQSGHITAVGFHLYCQMLETAVAALRGKPLPGRADVPVTLDFLETRPERVLAGQVLPAFLPVDYVADEKSRMEVFRRLSNAGSTGEVKAVRTLLRDRFGRIPEAAENLLSLHALRVLAAEKKIDSLTVKGDRLIIERGGEPLQIEGRFPRLQATQPKAKFAEIIAAVRTM